MGLFILDWKYVINSSSVDEGYRDGWDLTIFKCGREQLKTNKLIQLIITNQIMINRKYINSYLIE